MARIQPNSASDRRWSQRYQRVQERKEMYGDYQQEKQRKKKQHKGAYTNPYGFNPEYLMKLKTAVVCNSAEQVEAVIRSFKAKYPSSSYPPVSLAQELVLSTAGEVAFSAENYIDWLVDVDHAYKMLDYATPSYYFNKEYTLLDFYECCQVKDLGEIYPSSIGIDNLLEV